jgi:hypothetical protein
MMDAPDNRCATIQGHSQSRDAEFIVDTFGNAPADDLARVYIENRSQKDKASSDTNVGDIGSPRLIGSVQSLVLNQIGVSPAAMFGIGGNDEAAPKNGTEPELRHHTPDSFGIDGLSAPDQFFMDSPVAITGKLRLYGFDLIPQSSIALLPAGTVDSRLIVVGAGGQSCHLEPFRN